MFGLKNTTLNGGRQLAIAHVTDTRIIWESDMAPWKTDFQVNGFQCNWFSFYGARCATEMWQVFVPKILYNTILHRSFERAATNPRLLSFCVHYRQLSLHRIRCYAEWSPSLCSGHLSANIIAAHDPLKPKVLTKIMAHRLKMSVLLPTIALMRHLNSEPRLFRSSWKSTRPQTLI